MNTSMLEPTGGAGITGAMVPVKIIYRFITGVSGSIMFLLLAKWLAARLPRIPYIITIGRNTLGIYILHTFVFGFFDYRGYLFDNEILSIIFCFTIAALVTIISNSIFNMTSRNRFLGLLLWGK